ncbi:MAG: hypothetical protein ACRD3W_23020 [Terriglobales bacterium]
MTEILDIKFTAKGIARALSNFTHRSFVLDGVQCASIEGVLQATKTANVATQKARCLLSGVEAKHSGRNGPDWQRDQMLHWQNSAMPRKGAEYRAFLERLFNAVFAQCPEFCQSLADSGQATLTHSIGKTDRSKTVLTRQEFIQQLERLREQLRNRES